MVTAIILISLTVGTICYFKILAILRKEREEDKTILGKK